MLHVLTFRYFFYADEWLLDSRICMEHSFLSPGNALICYYLGHIMHF